MSDNESDLHEDSLVFDSNCETSDNISIGSSSGTVSVVSQENQSRATKKNTPNFHHEESSDDDSDDSEFDTSELTDNSSQIINWDEETQERVKAELTYQFKNIATSNYEQTTASIYTTSSNSNNLHHNHLTQTSIAKEWWAIWKTKFSNIAKLARKYLSISAFFVPSKRLFSDAGNCITVKCTQLNP
ncbi:7373_t:CDS:2, partial [Racocetra fulgida]